jgi:hypothetical protein
MPNPVTCPRCGKRRRLLWLPPRFRRGFADWRITASGNPLIGDGGDINISTGDECCCCETCCEQGTAPPQLELDASGLTMNTFSGCETGCADFADVFLLDFRNLRSSDDPTGGPGAGFCVWRYCGTLDCVGTPVSFGWDCYIYSTGTSCRAQATPWIDNEGCDDFELAEAGGTDASWFADLPTDPDDCCDALSSPFTLDSVTGSGSRQVVSLSAGCQFFNVLTSPITIQAVGC